MGKIRVGPRRARGWGTRRRLWGHSRSTPSLPADRRHSSSPCAASTSSRCPCGSSCAGVPGPAREPSSLALPRIVNCIVLLGGECSPTTSKSFASMVDRFHKAVIIEALWKRRAELLPLRLRLLGEEFIVEYCECHCVYLPLFLPCRELGFAERLSSEPSVSRQE
jgi:hypothetical protein